MKGPAPKILHCLKAENICWLHLVGLHGGPALWAQPRGCNQITTSERQRTVSCITNHSPSPLCFPSHRNNCYGTLNVRDLATQMPNLKSFVHVSTYFVNNHRPRNQLIEEKIFPMDLGGMSASEVVAQIMAAPKDEASALAAKHMAR